jgi:hypothetical protein
MAAPKRATHVVKHKRLYLAVDGKFQHFPEGKTLTLTSKQAEKLGSRVSSLVDQSPADLTSSTEGDKKPGKANAEKSKD